MRELPFAPRFSLCVPQSPRCEPVATFVPRHYEPRYAYPLLVMFHGRGGDERQLLRVMPRLSNRNYIAIGLRGTQSTPVRRDGSAGYGWAQAVRGATDGEGIATLMRPRIPQLSEATSEYLAEYVFQAVAQVRRRFNIQKRQIYLMGYGEGAAAAYRLGLGMPSRFAGIVAVNGWLPRNNGPLMWLPQARRLRVFIVHGSDNHLVPVSAAENAYRLLSTTGIPTTFHVLESGHRINSESLRLINSWVMEFCRNELPVEI